MCIHFKKKNLERIFVEENFIEKRFGVKVPLSSQQYLKLHIQWIFRGNVGTKDWARRDQDYTKVSLRRYQYLTICKQWQYVKYVKIKVIQCSRLGDTLEKSWYFYMTFYFVFQIVIFSDKLAILVFNFIYVMCNFRYC